jgi:hypothetical protein
MEDERVIDGKQNLSVRQLDRQMDRQIDRQIVQIVHGGRDYLDVPLSACMSIQLSVYPSVCLSVCCLSVCCLTVCCLSVCCLSICLLSVYLSVVCLSVVYISVCCLSICLLSVCLSVKEKMENRWVTDGRQILTDREADRQTARQTNRQLHRQTNRQRDRQIVPPSVYLSKHLYICSQYRPVSYAFLIPRFQLASISKRLELEGCASLNF